MKHRHHPDILEDQSSKKNPFILQTNISPDNSNEIVQGQFYCVTGDINSVPLDDYFDHGYDSRKDFLKAINELVKHWGGREGESIEEFCPPKVDGQNVDQRHRMIHLRFHDTPGGCPDEAWLPYYLLSPIPTPKYVRWHNRTSEEEIIDEIDSLLWDK